MYFFNYRLIKSQYILSIADEYLVSEMTCFVNVTYAPDFKDLELLKENFRSSWLVFSNLWIGNHPREEFQKVAQSERVL